MTAHPPRDPSAPLVVAMMMPFPPDPELNAAIEALHPNAEVHHTPYFESAELRSARGRAGGQNLDGHDVPEVSEAMQDAWHRATVAVGMDLPDDAPARFPNLELLVGMTAGVDHLDVDELRGMGVRLTTASGIGAVAISEFVMARLLQIWKQFRTLEAQQANHDWTVLFGSEVNGRIIGIVGLGAIGRQVAIRARAFGMRVLATRASARPGDTDPDVDVMFAPGELPALLGQCDAVVSALPSTSATVDLFDAARFAQMKPGALFCNVGRGAHVVEDDLIAALGSGHLGAAALDVTRVEPLPPDSPLWDEPNVYLSPHTSVSLDRYAENAAALALDNLTRFVAGRPLRNEILL